MNDSNLNYNSLLVKKCRVCSDKASAFNFNGLSCESCKSFFRRNANREHELECNKFGACEMTVKTRKFCAKCRLTRCLAIGMRKEFICKRKQNQITTEDQEVSYIKSELLNSFNASPSASFLTLANDSQFPALTTYEKLKIEEVVGYYKAFKEENTIKDVIETPNRDEWFKYCEEYGKFLVRIIKNIGYFKNFSMQDKLLLVRNFISIFFDLRYTFFYDKEGDFSLIQEITEQKYCFKTRINMWSDLISEEIFREWKELVLKNKTVMMNDPVIRDLLITMALFREHDKISSPEVLRYNYLEIYYLLRRYIQVKIRNRDRFERHMKMFHRVLADFPQMHEQSRQFYQLISPHYSNQLLEEIYTD